MTDEQIVEPVERRLNDGSFNDGVSTTEISMIEEKTVSTTEEVISLTRQKLENSDTSFCVVNVASVESTHKLLEEGKVLKLFASAAAKALLLSASEQPGGIGSNRGTEKRKWLTKKGNVHVSLVLWVPTAVLHPLSEFTLTMTAAIAAALESLAGRTYDKEVMGVMRPNDLLVQGKKSGGVLATLLSDEEGVRLLDRAGGVRSMRLAEYLQTHEEGAAHTDFSVATLISFGLNLQESPDPHAFGCLSSDLPNFPATTNHKLAFYLCRTLAELCLGEKAEDWARVKHWLANHTIPSNKG